MHSGTRARPSHILRGSLIFAMCMSPEIGMQWLDVVFVLMSLPSILPNSMSLISYMVRHCNLLFFHVLLWVFWVVFALLRHDAYSRVGGIGQQGRTDDQTLLQVSGSAAYRGTQSSSQPPPLSSKWRCSRRHVCRSSSLSSHLSICTSHPSEPREVWSPQCAANEV